MKAFVLMIAVTLACGGCVSGILVSRLNPEADIQIGTPWNLPMTQFKITITRHVTKCGGNMEGSVETIATSVVAPDFEQRYVLTSTGRFATSDIASTLSPAGYSTGINASSVDNTATVISNVVGTVAQIALFAAAAGGNAPLAASPQKCDDDIIPLVAALYPADPKKNPGLKDIVRDDTAKLADCTARLALLTARSVSDKNVKALVAKAVVEQDALQRMLTTDQKALTKALDATSDTTVVTWPLASNDVGGSVFQIDRNALLKWLPKSGGDSNTAYTNFDVYPSLYRQNPLDGSWIRKAPPEASKADISRGIPARMAAVGRLVLCAKKPCPDTLPQGPVRDKTQMASDFQVLQFGPIYLLPVAGGHFRSESVSVTLDQNGLPSQMQTSEKVAAAAAATGAAKDAATQLAALPVSLRGAELAKTQAETSQLKANADLETARASAGVQGDTATLSAQAAFVTAQNNLAIAQKNAGMVVSTAEITAQSNLLSAQSTLATAQANAATSDQTSVLSAQTVLVNAQAALINANAALAKAQTAAQ